VRRRRIRPGRQGAGCQLNLPPEERQLLESLPDQLAQVLTGIEEEDEVPENLRRLFPHAYVSDEEAERAFAASTRKELTSSHHRALKTLASTARASSLSEEEMGEWMTALNDLRLVLGTALQVSDDENWEPRGPLETEYVIYQYLTLLQAELIDLMEMRLPPPNPVADDLLPDDPWGEPLGGLRWDGTPQPDTPFGESP
jgi:hypothetical protein